MYLGRVVGRVWSTVKNPALEGRPLLVVQPLTPELEPAGRRIVATDATGAGEGELVWWVRGREASFAFLPDEVPSDVSVVGIVDEIHLNRKKRADR
jgi:microcompartment protein CcmK/EutM